MGEVLTLAEIYSRFDSEWVLVGDPKTTEDLEVESGTVLAHSKDRDEVYRKAIEADSERLAVLYTGSMPKNTAIIL
jgi:hypothetical protein